MNVGTVIRKVAVELDTPRIVQDPLEATVEYEEDPSHAEIVGMPPGDSDQAALIGDLIVECIIGLHPAIVGHDG